MKAETANSKRLGILGNCKTSSNQEILDSIVRKWRQKLGYCSIFAAIPALLASQLPGVQHFGTNNRTVGVAGARPRSLENLNITYSTPELLKRQSEYLLPHQQSNFSMAAAFAGNDDCPGRPIPGGTYTAAAPYVDFGDTTGANNTVGFICGPYCYSFAPAGGPDQIYSFKLLARGPNPRIEVIPATGNFGPLVYILHGGEQGCPGGIDNSVFDLHYLRCAWWEDCSTRLGQISLRGAPLNVPLHLFVDSGHLRDSGPYTLRIQDVTIAPVGGDPVPGPVRIDPSLLVRQHYLDFLNRTPDAAGFAFWTNEITSCGTNIECHDRKQTNVSAAFFLSIEFQETGYLVYRFYKASFGNIPGVPVPIKRNEFLPDTQRIGTGVVVNQAGWQQVLENNKQAFAAEFVQRQRFISAFPASMTPPQFVDQLFANAQISPGTAERESAISEFGSATTTGDLAARARALRRVAESALLAQAEFNRAFVLMQYFGYLQRDPNDPPEPALDFQGYNFWLTKLNQFNGNFVNADMVKAFISSSEYRQRFGL